MRNFIGYSDLINNFKDRCLKNTLSHAHLIAGEDGIGKSKLANILSSKCTFKNHRRTTNRSSHNNIV